MAPQHHHHHHHQHHHHQHPIHSTTQQHTDAQVSVEAHTIEYCRRKYATLLRLTRVPNGADFRDLTHLTHLNLSECDISSNSAVLGLLPTSLQQLHLTSCGLHSLPLSITRLAELKQLYAGANWISDITLLTRMPKLQHAGFSYNCIQSLPAAHACKGCTALLSLDVSHCRLDDLQVSMESLLAMPSLQLLSLAGNPMCLLPSYQHELKTMLSSNLMMLDGQRVEQHATGRTVAPSASIPPRPPDTNQLFTALLSPSPNLTQHPLLAMLAEPAVPGSEAPVTLLSVELGPLEVLEDPWASVRASWEAQAAAEAAGAAAAAAASALAAAQAAAEPPAATPSRGAQQGSQTASARAPVTETPAAVPLITVPTQAEALVMTTAAAAADAAAAAAAAAVAVPKGPLQPYIYHFELEDCDGASAATYMELDTTIGSVTETQVSLACQGTTTGTDSQQVEAALELMPQPSLETPPDLIPAVQLSLGESISKWGSMLSGAATQYASIPCSIPPPQQPGKPGTPEPPAALAKGKGKDTKVAKPSKGAKPSTPLTKAAGQVNDVSMLQRGAMKLLLHLPANLHARDWLLHGLRLRLYRTQVIAVPRAPSSPARSATPEPVLTKLSKQAGKAKPAAAAVTDAESVKVLDESNHDFQAKTELVAEGVVPASALASGSITRVCQHEVPLIPVPRLWDDKGVRMALKDPRHQQQPIARLAANLALHVLPPGVTLADDAAAC